MINKPKTPGLYYFQIRSGTLNKISGHDGVPRAVPQYLFWHDLGKEVNYSSISDDAIKLREQIKKRVS